MPSPTILTALLGLFAAAFTTAAPTARAACPTTIPSSFKIKEQYGYFEVSNGIIINDPKKSTASTFHINNTVYGGPTVPLLSTFIKGVDYGAFVTDSTNGTIVLVPTAVAQANYYSPVDVTLGANCALSFTISEAHADFYLQECTDGLIRFSTSVHTNCTQITPTLVTS